MSMDDLQAQLDRVTRVYDSCGGDATAMKKKGKKQDPFNQVKSAVLQAIGKLSSSIELRDKMDRRGSQSSANQVRVKNDIRKMVTTLRKETPTLRKLLYMEQAKAAKKKSKLTPEQLSAREEIVEGVEKQVRQVIGKATGREEAKDDTTGFSRFDVETGEIVDSSGTPILSGGGGQRVAQEEELSEDHRQALAQMQRNNEEQDALVDQIGDVVGRLKNLGQAIGEELDVQNQQLSDLENQVDNAQDKLDKINDRMKETLEQLNSKSDKFCMYGICLIILLGIVTVVYNMVF